MLTADEIFIQWQNELSTEEKEVYQREQSEALLILIKTLSKNPTRLAQTLSLLTEEQRQLLQQLLNSPVS